MPEPSDAFRPVGEAEARFEAAADAVVTGDLDGLTRLLAEDPTLARARSPRPHRATLLHYVAANGFEDFRQRTPADAPEVARLLFRHGAVADVTCPFGEETVWTTPMCSLVSSVWPHRAGLHAALVDAFVAGGARVDGLSDESGPLELALGFGYPEAAEALVRNGARIGHVLHAAGLGRLDLVRKAFDEHGRLRAAHREPSGWCTRKRVRGEQDVLDEAFVLACRHRHPEVAAFLLERGARLGARGDQGFTALHAAAWYGHHDLLEWLLARGAPLDVRNDYGGTVLDGTCWGAVHAPVPGVDPLPIVARLIDAGADPREVTPFPTGREDLDRLLRARGLA